MNSNLKRVLSQGLILLARWILSRPVNNDDILPDEALTLAEVLIDKKLKEELKARGYIQ